MKLFHIYFLHLEELVLVFYEESSIETRGRVTSSPLPTTLPDHSCQISKYIVSPQLLHAFSSLGRHLRNVK